MPRVGGGDGIGEERKGRNGNPRLARGGWGGGGKTTATNKKCSMGAALGHPIGRRRLCYLRNDITLLRPLTFFVSSLAWPIPDGYESRGQIWFVRC